MRRIAMAAALLGLMTLGAAAQEGRFQLERSGDGFLRLDRQTGEISRCADQDGKVSCQTAEDERAGLMMEIERLDGAIRALEERIAALEAERAPAASGNLPNEQEFEQSLGLMERFIRRFYGVIQDLEKQFGTGGEEPMPNQT